MWQRVKRFFVFQGKALEFKYRTWESRRAIRRAYQEGGVSVRLYAAARAHARLIVLVLTGGAVIIAALTIGPPAVGYVTYAYKAARAAAAASHAARARRALEAKAKPAAPVSVVKKQEAAKPVAFAKAFDTSVAGQAAGLALHGEMPYCVLANKATKTVFLLSRDGQGGAWKIAEQFPAVMGRNEGQKQTAGDRKTPEGIYFIVGRKDKAELNSLYGPLAFVLNYPNETDRQEGRTGQGIWIHGMPEDSSRIVTRGCIVMQNIWLLALERYLKLGVGTPVVIVDKPELPSPERFPDYNQIEQKRKVILHEYAQREEDFKDVLFKWKTAWASRDIEAYSQFYDTQRFLSGGMSWNAWRERKKNIFQSLDTIEVSVDNMRLVDCSESTAVVVFRQLYAASPQASPQASLQAAKQSAKRLCFYKNGSRWLIYREETFSTEEFLL